MIVRVAIDEQRMSTAQRERLRRHLEALRRPGGQRRRQLQQVINLLSTSDDTLDIAIDRHDEK